MEETYIGCDFDGTIYNGNCSIDFFLFCLRKKQGIKRFLFKHIGNYIKYLLRLHSFDRNAEKFYQFTAHLDSPEELVREFWDHNIKKIKDWFYSLKMENVLILTGSADFLMESLQERINFADYIATEVDMETGTLKDGVSCIGREKLNRFVAEKPGARLEAFYSDSKKDRHIASVSRVSYRVKRNTIRLWRSKKH